MLAASVMVIQLCALLLVAGAESACASCRTASNRDLEIAQISGTQGGVRLAPRLPVRPPPPALRAMPPSRHYYDAMPAPINLSTPPQSAVPVPRRSPPQSNVPDSSVCRGTMNLTLCQHQRLSRAACKNRITILSKH
jgi:hypothetical protein